MLFVFFLVVGFATKNAGNAETWKYGIAFPGPPIPPKDEKTGEAYSWESIIPFLRNRFQSTQFRHRAAGDVLVHENLHSAPTVSRGVISSSASDAA